MDAKKVKIAIPLAVMAFLTGIGGAFDVGTYMSTADILGVIAVPATMLPLFVGAGVAVLLFIWAEK